jgi:hypothetical protein
LGTGVGDRNDVFAVDDKSGLAIDDCIRRATRTADDDW